MTNKEKLEKVERIFEDLSEIEKVEDGRLKGFINKINGDIFKLISLYEHIEKITEGIYAHKGVSESI